MIKQVIANAQNFMMELKISSMADSDNDINKKHHKYTLNEALPDYSNLSV